MSKGQEIIKNLIKLFKENINLKNHFKNLVNPNCSCTKSLELIVSLNSQLIIIFSLFFFKTLILANLTTLNPSNTVLSKRLIERMSSIVIDDESFDCLIKLVETKIFNCKPLGFVKYLRFMDINIF